MANWVASYSQSSGVRSPTLIKKCKLCIPGYEHEAYNVYIQLGFIYKFGYFEKARSQKPPSSLPKVNNGEEDSFDLSIV